MRCQVDRVLRCIAQGLDLIWPLPFMGTENYVWLTITMCLEISLAIVLWRRRAYKEFRFFFAYVVYSFAASQARTIVSSNYGIYFYIYWYSNAGYVIVGILALHEAFHYVFSVFYDDWWFAWIFPVASALIFILTIWVWSAHPPLKVYAIIRLILSAEMAVNIIQSLLFGLFLLLVAHSNIHWRSYPFGVVGGFAIYSLGAWGTYWVLPLFATKYTFLLRVIPTSYIVALVFWLLTFARPPEEEEEPKWKLSITPDEALNRLEGYSGFFDWYRNRKKGKTKT
jgi:hypothetical protein